jgi:hypothetical protein
MIQEIFEFTQQQLQQNALTTVSPYDPNPHFLAIVPILTFWQSITLHVTLSTCIFSPGPTYAFISRLIFVFVSPSYFTLLAPYPPDMILGIARSHAQHAADKIRQVQLPPSWNPRPVVSLPLHIGFVSGDFRAHVTAHLLQVPSRFLF